MPEFQPFPKISRWSREVIITEKIDGTNAQVVVSDDGSSVCAGSRSRFITPEADNFGFAKWVEANAEELKRLGPGTHYGEWMGQGIQRGYGLKEKRFYLFNVSRWEAERPACCHVVPVLCRCHADDLNVHVANMMQVLRESGSFAVPGFMKPEGVVIFHVAGNALFKKTLDRDEKHKGEE